MELYLWDTDAKNVLFQLDEDLNPLIFSLTLTDLSYDSKLWNGNRKILFVNSIEKNKIEDKESYRKIDAN